MSMALNQRNVASPKFNNFPSLSRSICLVKHSIDLPQVCNIYKEKAVLRRLFLVNETYLVARHFLTAYRTTLTAFRARFHRGIVAKAVAVVCALFTNFRA